MKKIIGGKKYDTGTARECAVYESDCGRADFQWYRETLYLKRTGEYFVHGEGGPASRYAQAVGTGGFMGGEKIVPLAYDAARKWAEDALDAEDYEAVFGVVSEDGGECDLHVKLSPAAYAAIQRKAQSDGTSIRAVVESLAISLQPS